MWSHIFLIGKAHIQDSSGSYSQKELKDWVDIVFLLFARSGKVTEYCWARPRSPTENMQFVGVASDVSSIIVSAFLGYSEDFGTQ